MVRRSLAHLAGALTLALASACGGVDPEPFDTGGASHGAGNTALELRQPYPEPPFGTKVGAVVEDFRFLGWRDPSAAGYDPGALEHLSFADYYDPNAEGDYRYVAVGAMAVWCGVCRSEAEQIRREGLDATLRARGVLLLHTLFEDNDHEPASPADLRAWASQFEITYPFVLDNGFKLGAFFDREATPMNLIFDTATMRVVYLEVGWVPEGEGSMLEVLDGLLGG